MEYAIAGANGSVGLPLAGELAARGVPFRAIARRRDVLEARLAPYAPFAHVVAADIADPDQARAALEGIKTLIYLVGVPYPQFRLHPQYLRTTVEAAKRAGVERIVHLSNVYPYGLPQSELVDETQPLLPNSFKGRMREEQEDLLFEADRRGDVRACVVRAPDFYGPTAQLSLAWQIFSAAVAGKRAAVIAPIDTPHEFVYVPDLARTLVDIAQTEAAYGHAWNLAGPGRITVREFARRVYARAGTPLQLMPVGKTLLRLFGLIDPTMRELVEMHYLQTTPVNLDDRRLLALLPTVRKTGYDTGIAETIATLKP